MYIAFANGNIDYITDNLPEQITWLIIGEKIINGKKNFLTELEKHKLWKTKDLIIDTIITHGTDASVAGLATLENNTGFSFCDIYKFKGAGGTGINSITTFIIDLKN